MPEPGDLDVSEVTFSFRQVVKRSGYPRDNSVQDQKRRSHFEKWLRLFSDL
jgi:hypothetical protein